MIVQVLSFGSLWSQSRRDASIVWNTTGVPSASGVRSCAKQFGQIRLPAGHAQRVHATAGTPITTWVSSALADFDGMRTLHLIRPSDRGQSPDAYVVVQRGGGVGRLGPGSWDERTTELLSLSEHRGQQEAMLLMRAFGWLRGDTGYAILVPAECGAGLTVQKW